MKHRFDLWSKLRPIIHRGCSAVRYIQHRVHRIPHIQELYYRIHYSAHVAYFGAIAWGAKEIYLISASILLAILIIAPLISDDPD